MGRFKGTPERNRQYEHRINQDIRVPNVRVIGPEGENIGLMTARDAFLKAQALGLDLVEISPNTVPPVCKILDYGKFRFQEAKKKAEAKKHQHVVEVKEMAIRPRTDENDYQIKLRKIKEFLAEGNKAKINLRFRGREVTHADSGTKMIDRIANDTADIARVEFRSGLEGRFMSLILAPEKKKGGGSAAAPATGAATPTAAPAAAPVTPAAAPAVLKATTEKK